MAGDGGTSPDPGTRRAAEVAGMFGAIAPTYDLLNHLLSLNVDRRWRKRAVRALEPLPGRMYLDLCTGTGDLALALLERCPAGVVGADFAGPMLRIAKTKARRLRRALRLAQADALRLPFRDALFDGVMVAFGVRNFEDLAAGLREMDRVLKPGGRAVILEFSTPRSRLFGALYRLYFGRVLPAVGRLVSGRRGAYGYLPATVEGFPGDEAFASILRGAGFDVLSQKPLTFGIATLHLAARRT